MQQFDGVDNTSNVSASSFCKYVVSKYVQKNMYSSG